MAERLNIRVLKGGYKLECAATRHSIRLDCMGRWSSYRRGSCFYRRCIDGSIVKGKEAVELGCYETGQVYRDARLWMGVIRFRPEVTKDRELSCIISIACAHQDNAYVTLKAMYRDVYPESVPILPPDRYRDVVIQPAIGCPNRRCTFCAFYKDKPFNILQPSAFDRHLDGVIQLLGKQEISARGGIFIGSANAMALSQRRLLCCLEAVHKKLGSFDRGIAAFADPDYSAPRSQLEWQVLAERNVQQLVIGLETGWEELRARLGKSGDLTKVYNAVHAIKAAGIAVGITLLVGVCPPEEIAQHHHQTLCFLQSLPLTAEDKVYISLLDEGAESHADRVDEKALLLTALKDDLLAKVIPYQMQRFNYYA